MQIEAMVATDSSRFVEGLRRGDDAAFAILVRQHAGRMLSTARRLLRN